MTLEQYLRQKYPTGRFALTADEAGVLHIPYPLRGGWAKRHADMQITPMQRTRLHVLMQRRRSAMTNQSEIRRCDRAIKALEAQVA